jgi:hypothetical protein
MSIPHRRANPDNVAAGEGTFFVTESPGAVIAREPRSELLMLRVTGSVKAGVCL